MSMNEALRFLAGTVVLVGVALGWAFSPWFYLLVVFAALNLIQSAFSKWCPAMAVLRKLGFR